MKEKLCLELQIFREKSTVLYMAIFSIAVSIAGMLGEKIDISKKIMYTPNLHDFIRVGIHSMFFFVIFMFLLLILRNCKCKEESSEFSMKRLVVRTVILFACWLPYFLMFFPGSLSSDSYVTVNQVLGNYQLHNHHPIMFTLFVKICMTIGMKVGGLETGIAFYSITQMILMALGLSGIVEWMKIKAIPKGVTGVFLIFYAIDGLIAVYSFTMWKDILFSLWIVLLTIYLYELTNMEPEKVVKKREWSVLVFLCLLVAFGRNNGVYVVALVMIGVAIANKKVWKKIAARAVTLVTIIVIIQGPVYSSLGIGKGNFAESLAIPIQQIAYTVYHEGEIGEGELDYLERLIPLETMKELYNPFSADPIKFSEKFDNYFLEENKGEFLKVWAKILPSNLDMYIKAYLMHTWGYWDLEVTNWRGWYGAPDIDKLVKVNNTDYIQKITGVNFKEVVSNIYEVKVNLIPGVRCLYSIGFSFWLFAFCLVIVIMKKQYARIVMLLPLAGVWLTLMVAAPVFCEFRYMFAFHLALPIVFSVIWLVLIRKEKNG